MDILNYGAQDILAIPARQAKTIFGKDPDEVKKCYRALVRKWHPDINKNKAAHDVFQHITLLHRGWESLSIPTTILLDMASGPAHVVYSRQWVEPVGESFLTENYIVTLLASDQEDLFLSTRKVLSQFRYPSDLIREKTLPSLPVIDQSSVMSDKRFAVMVKRPAGYIRLRDLVDFYTPELLDPKHLAWMISRLLHLCVYLEWSNLMHGDISLDSVFIHPQNHFVALLGGWWYVRPLKEKIVALPARTVEICSTKVLANKQATTNIDLDLVRLLGREILSIKGATSKNSTIPTVLVHWLLTSSSGDARADYQEWYDKIIPGSFGARRFTELPVTISDIY